MTKRPNIIIIMPDQQRADSLGCYGNKFTVTPNLDRLAQESMVFDRAFTPFPICTPARCTMWTGQYPHAHGIEWNYYNIDNLLEEEAKQKTTVFDLLKDSGYLNAYFGKWHLGEKPHPAFDVWDAFNSRGGHWVDGYQSFQNGVWKPAAQTDACIKFLESDLAKGDQPFIMVQGYYPPHQPYTAPKEFYEPYRGKGVPFAGYYASVTGLDFHTGRILETLEREGLKDDTVFIYLSDHGDTFNYREGSKNKFVCHDDAINVPFIVSWPSVVQSGGRVASPIGLQDLAPTILDLAEAPIPDWMHGKSIVPLLKGNAEGWRDAFYIENRTFKDRTDQRALRTDKWKLVLDRENENMLFDLENDPEEELNVYVTPREDFHIQFRHFPDYSETIIALAKRLAEEADKIGDNLGRDLAEKAIAAKGSG